MSILNKKIFSTYCYRIGNIFTKQVTNGYMKAVFDVLIKKEFTNKKFIYSVNSIINKEEKLYAMPSPAMFIKHSKDYFDELKEIQSRAKSIFYAIKTEEVIHSKMDFEKNTYKNILNKKLLDLKSKSNIDKYEYIRNLYLNSNEKIFVEKFSEEWGFNKDMKEILKIN